VSGQQKRWLITAAVLTASTLIAAVAVPWHQGHPSTAATNDCNRLLTGAATALVAEGASTQLLHRPVQRQRRPKFTVASVVNGQPESTSASSLTHFTLLGKGCGHFWGAIRVADAPYAKCQAYRWTRQGWKST
jgi:hypothetical protein